MADRVSAGKHSSADREPLKNCDKKVLNNKAEDKKVVDKKSQNSGWKIGWMKEKKKII